MIFFRTQYSNLTVLVLQKCSLSGSVLWRCISLWTWIHSTNTSVWTFINKTFSLHFTFTSSVSIWYWSSCVLYLQHIYLCFICLQSLQLASSFTQIMQCPFCMLKVSMQVTPNIHNHILMSHSEAHEKHGTIRRKETEQETFLPEKENCNTITLQLLFL